VRLDEDVVLLWSIVLTVIYWSEELGAFVMRDAFGIAVRLTQIDTSFISNNFTGTTCKRCAYALLLLISVHGACDPTSLYRL